MLQQAETARNLATAQAAVVAGHLAEPNSIGSTAPAISMYIYFKYLGYISGIAIIKFVLTQIKCLCL